MTAGAKVALRYVHALLGTLGVDPLKTLFSLRGLPAYVSDFIRLRKTVAASGFPFGKPYPCLDDRFWSGGTAKGHYFHQDLLVARRLFELNPRHHFDIGSRIDGFVAHVASFRKIEILDIRPVTSQIPNVTFRQGDLMKGLPPELNGVCDSLSCLHTLEHFGLGRYGDPIDAEGHIRGFANLTAMLQPGGKLFLSTPIGPQRIEFNAHRVFSTATLVTLFSQDYSIDRFSFVDDHGDLHENVEMKDDLTISSYGCHYGCGIFELTRISTAK